MSALGSSHDHCGPSPALADPLPTPTTFVEVLRLRARVAGDETAFVFDGDEGEERVTYGELDKQARAIGATLQAESVHGTRLLLLYPPGLDYVAALFGCFYAGAVAVPSYPPDPARLDRTLSRLLTTLEDASVDVALTNASIRPLLEHYVRGAAGVSPPRSVLDTTAGGTDTAGDWRPPDVAAEDLALLQYTSGSTASPRGVMLTHRNLLHNSELIRGAFGHSSRSRGVIWLPPYHDMGLIGGVLQPVYAGFPCVLMSPLTFLRNPLRWLAAISKHRATSSGGPNFAYDLCVRRIGPDQCAGLDLASWDVAFNGSEPVRKETIDAFSDAFEGSGFRREAFYPCYGLAESTLMVTGGARLRAARVQRVDRTAFEERGAAIEAESESQAKEVVSCGRPGPGHRVVIVDPASGSPLSAGRVGEIWVSGPSVAAGYWQLPHETAETFYATVADARRESFLRTGDLGFLSRGELFVTGRIKEVLVVAGRNIYPIDAERACEDAVPSLRRGCGAAFAYGSDGDGRIAIVFEIADEAASDYDEVVAAIRGAIGRALNVRVDAIALIKPKTIPKTSSGKVQRLLCRSQFLDGTLSVVAAWSLTARDAPR